MGNAMHRYGGDTFVEYDPADWQPLREEQALNEALRAWQEVLLDLVLRDRDRLEAQVYDLEEELRRGCDLCDWRNHYRDDFDDFVVR